MLNNQESLLGADNSNWKLLVQKLEGVVLEHEGEKSASDAENIQDCVAQYRSEFEAAEFVLGGKRMIVEQIQAFRTDTSRELMTKKAGSFEFTSELLSGAIVVEVEEEGINAPNLDDLISRKKRYEQLWNLFLGELRQRLMTTAAMR